MGSAINQYVINTTNDYHDEDSPFDSVVTIITSGDKVTYNDIYAEYVRAGLQDTVNNNWIPEQYFKFIPYNFTKHKYSVFTYPGRLKMENVYPFFCCFVAAIDSGYILIKNLNNCFRTH